MDNEEEAEMTTKTAQHSRAKKSVAPPAPPRSPRFTAYLAGLPGCEWRNDELPEDYAKRLEEVAKPLRAAWKKNLVTDNSIRLRQIEALLPSRPKKATGFRASGAARAAWYEEVGALLGVHRDQVKWAVAAYEALTDFEERAAGRELRWTWEAVMDLLLARQLRHVPAACDAALRNLHPDCEVTTPVHPTHGKRMDPDVAIAAADKIARKLDFFTLSRLRATIDYYLAILEEKRPPAIGGVDPLAAVDGVFVYDARALSEAGATVPPGTSVATEIDRYKARSEARRVVKIGGRWWAIEKTQSPTAALPPPDPLAEVEAWLPPDGEEMAAAK